MSGLYGTAVGSLNSSSIDGLSTPSISGQLAATDGSSATALTGLVQGLSTVYGSALVGVNVTALDSNPSSYLAANLVIVDSSDITTAYGLVPFIGTGIYGTGLGPIDSGSLDGLTLSYITAQAQIVEPADTLTTTNYVANTAPISARGTTSVRDPSTGNWSPLKYLYRKINGTWQPVTAGWVKNAGTWDQIYPTPTGAITVEPAPLIFNMFETSSQTESIEVINSGTQPLTINSISDQGTGGFLISGSPSLPLTLNPQQVATFPVTVIGQEPTITADGNVFSDDIVNTADINNLGQGNIIFTATTPILGSFTTVVPVAAEIFTTYANITANVSSLTSRYYQGQIAPGQAVTITNTGNGANLVISGFTSMLNSVVTGVPGTLANNQTATFTVQASQYAIGSYNDVITVLSNAANGNQFEIPFSITVDPAYPLIATVPTAISTGYYVNDSLPVITVTINNAGQQTLTIASIVSSGGSTIGTVPSSIPAQSSATFTVTLPNKPQGSYTDQISITSNAANQTVLTIPVAYTVQVTHGSQTFSSPGIVNWTVPDHVHYITVTTIGGGGGGGGGTARIDRGDYGGGGGGGQSEIRQAQNVAVTPGSVIAVAVGAGGPQGSPRDGPYSAGLSGTAGGDSYLVVNSAIPCRAAGGAGGTVSQLGFGSTAPGGVSGTLVGTGIGTLIQAGQSGLPGFFNQTTTTQNYVSSVSGSNFVGGATYYTTTVTDVEGGSSAPGFLAITGGLGIAGQGGIGSSQPAQAQLATTGTGYGAGGGGGGGNYSDSTLPGMDPAPGSAGLIVITW